MRIAFFLVFLLGLVQVSAADYYELALRELRLARGASLFTEPVEETPWITTVITEEERARFGWHNLRDLLEYQPSFYSVQDVNERVVAHRGIFRTITSHLLFLEEGVDLSLPGFRNFVADASFPLLGVSRVEIVRGPGASLYGDAAFTGVVNLERKDWPERLRVRSGLGDYDREEGDLAFRLHGKSWGELRGLFHYADLEGEEYHGSGYSHLLHPRPRNYALSLRWNRGPFLLSYWRLLSRYDTPRSQRGHPLSDEDLKPFGSREKVRQDIFHLEGHFRFKGLEFRFSPYFRYFKVDTPQVKNTHAEGNFTALNIELEGRALGVKGFLLWPHRHGEFLLGAKWETEDYEKNFIESFSASGWRKMHYPVREEDNWALFAQEKRKIRRNIYFNLGIRYDHYESFGGEWSPRAALIWKVFSGLTFKFTYGEAFQAPPYLYRRKNRFGYGASKTLRAERVSNYQASILYRQGRSTSFTLTAYLSHFRDLLVYSSAIRAYENAGHLDLWGLEFEARHLGESWMGFLNYTLQSVSEAKNLSRVSGKRLNYLPRWMVKGGISFKLSARPEVYLSPQFRLYGRAPTPSGWLSPYAVWDLNLLLRQKPWEISFKVENLFDHHYFRGGTVPPYPWPGRLFMLRIGARF